MNNTTQQAIVHQLREKILNGELSPGQRLVEAQVAERLGVSRTPLRYALSILAAEGLLERSGARGYVVRRFGVDDVLDAIDVRGVLEGLAARSVAERGVTPELAQALADCLQRLDALFVPGSLSDDDVREYARLNGQFHTLITEAAGNAALNSALALNDRIPFVSAATVVFDEVAKEQQRAMLLYAQRQHHAIASALLRGEGARVEGLMKEHTQISKDSLNLAPSHPRLDGRPS